MSSCQGWNRYRCRWLTVSVVVSVLSRLQRHTVVAPKISPTMGEHPAEAPLFTYGVIADIQYADLDDGYNYARTSRRYYRTSLRLLKNALTSWSESPVKLNFVLQLGDIIDGFNKRHDASQRALDTVLAQFGPGQVHHVWGNHEFYNFSRSQLFRSGLNSALQADGTPYEAPARGDIYAYRFTPFPGFTFVVLDAYDVSPLGRDEDSEEYKSAMKLLKQHNSNEELNCPPDVWDFDLRYTLYNGGFSKDQLDWLDHVLSLADEKGEKVTIVSHLPVHPSSTTPLCLAWNYDDVLAIIRAHTSVVCYMAGHDHDGGYCRDPATGVHHLTFEGVIETPPHSNAFGTVFVYEDKMVLKGSGRTADRVLSFLRS